METIDAASLHDAVEKPDGEGEVVKIIEVTSLSDFVDKSRDLGDKLWFRGIPDSTYDLEPGLFRPPFKQDHEQDFRTQFQSRAVPFLTSVPGNEWEWLFVMQHFGVPTRLLDWTISGIAALAFAAFFRDDKKVGDRHYGKDIAVWCLDPLTLNSNVRLGSIERNRVPSIADNKEIQEFYFTPGSMEYPVAITGPMNNPRIVAQKGAFTLFPITNPTIKLNSVAKAHEFLHKITIAEKNIGGLRKDLRRMGMSESTLFPDLSYLAMELKLELGGEG